MGGHSTDIVHEEIQMLSCNLIFALIPIWYKPYFKSNFLKIVNPIILYKTMDLQGRGYLIGSRVFSLAKLMILSLDRIHCERRL